MSVEELKQQGNAAAKVGKFEEAIEAYTQAIELEPQNHTLFSNRANFYFEVKRYNESLEDANKVIEINPAFVKGYIRKADALNAIGNIQEAYEALSAAEKVAPSDPSIEAKREELQNDMEYNMEIEIFGKNEDELRHKMMLNPKIYQKMQADPTLFDRLNLCRENSNFLQTAQGDQELMGVILELMGLGQLGAESAAESTAQATDEQHGCSGTACNKQCSGNCHNEQKETTDLPKEMQKDERSDEEIAADTLKEQGNDLFKQAKYAEAIELYEKAFATYKNITYLNNISTALLKQSKYEEAAIKAQEAYDFGNENPGLCTFQEKAKALTKKGSALHKLGRLEEAIDVLKESMLEHRDKTTLAILNKVQDDLQDFKKRSAYSPEEATRLKNEGNQLVKDNKYIEAIEKFTEGIKHLPIALMKEEDNGIYVALHNNRSLALFKAAQFNPSYDDCMIVLKYDSKNVKALLRKGQIERVRKQYYLSVETYTEILTADSSNREALEGLGKTQEKISQMQSGAMTEAEIQEVTQIAMADQSMQSLAEDPGMAQMIQAIQSNPAQAQQFLSDPVVGKKLNRLINAGILRVGPARH